jgi:hypothetical protein
MPTSVTKVKLAAANSNAAEWFTKGIFDSAPTAMQSTETSRGIEDTALSGVSLSQAFGESLSHSRPGSPIISGTSVI